MANIKNQGACGHRNDCKRIIKYRDERTEGLTVKKKEHNHVLSKGKGGKREKKWNGNSPQISIKRNNNLLVCSTDGVYLGPHQIN